MYKKGPWHAAPHDLDGDVDEPLVPQVRAPRTSSTSPSNLRSPGPTVRHSHPTLCNDGWSRSFRVGPSCPERVKMSPGARANPAAQSASRAALSHVRPCGRGPPSFTLEHKRLALRLRRREVFEGCPSRCPRGGVPWIRRAESGRLDPPLTTPEMAAMLSPKCAAQEASRREPYAPCGLRRR